MSGDIKMEFTIGQVNDRDAARFSNPGGQSVMCGYNLPPMLE